MQWHIWLLGAAIICISIFQWFARRPHATLHLVLDILRHEETLRLEHAEILLGNHMYQIRNELLIVHYSRSICHPKRETISYVIVGHAGGYHFTLVHGKVVELGSHFGRSIFKRKDLNTELISVCEEIGSIVHAQIESFATANNP